MKKIWLEYGIVHTTQYSRHCTVWVKLNSKIVNNKIVDFRFK